MSIYEDNTAVLLKNTPYLSGILQISKSKELELIATPSGFISGKFRGLSIHSRHNPLREAAQLIEREAGENISSALFYGFGLGYQAEAFRHKFPHVPILVIEPDPSFFHSVLESRDMRGLLSDPAIAFYVESDPEKLLPWIEKLPLSNIQIVRLRSMYEFHRQYYRRIDGIVSSYLSKKEININTLKRFGRLWIRNLSHNLEEIAEKPGIKEIKNKLKGIPSLVLASGPSLDTILPHLPELRKRMIIISVDTSLRACLRYQVEPDFLVVVDPQYWNTRHLDWISVEKTIVVSESSTHPRVFRMFDSPGFFASSLFPLGRFFESVIGKKGKIGTGGSVSTCAWDFARIVGSDPIFMAGLDLGFPGKKTHFHGAYFEQGFHSLAFKLNPVERMSYRYIKEAMPFFVPSNSGGLTLTDKRMIIYKWWFETQMNLHQSSTTCNLSPHGVAIPGMKLTDLKAALDLPVRRDRIDEFFFHFRLNFSAYWPIKIVGCLYS
jgi:hypothetical protein